METIRMSATAARNNFFELLNQVALGKQVIIERDNKEVAVVSPKQTMDWKGFIKAARRVKGTWKDYDPKDNPLRRQGAWGRLGKWDEDL